MKIKPIKMNKKGSGIMDFMAIGAVLIIFVIVSFVFVVVSAVFLNGFSKISGPLTTLQGTYANDRAINLLGSPPTCG